MSDVFSKKVYGGYIVKGDLHGAISYVSRFPEKTSLSRKYAALFEQEQYLVYDVDPLLSDILNVYQRYYRDVFYLLTGETKASENLRAGLAALLMPEKGRTGLDEMEEGPIAQAFSHRGLFFMGGVTGGHYGPYVWKTAETRTYDVELPDGMQKYTVRLLDGFIMRSWADYLSFGEIGPGGWSDDAGIISCVKSSYDLDSENFKVSLLKHEAQHAKDLAEYADISSEHLEYRAKLAELIYSNGQSLLEGFIHEADSSDRSNAHSLASDRIIKGFTQNLGVSRSQLTGLSPERIQAIARLLFEESSLLLKSPQS